jgi:pyruvate/2-oxoglutarate dehydrogenase complex dihydrolipoamide dehydrogenase (E3) component
MSQPEQFEVLILGSGQGGKLLAWHMARSGRRTAVVERRWIGGSCPNIACLPSKNEIWSARVAHLVHHAAQFGTATGPVATDMAKVRQRKRDMVNREIDFHLQQYKTSGDDFRIIRDNLAGGKRSTRDRLVPYCLFTDPPLAHVGLSEGDAQRQGVTVREVCESR